jgi:hypothetical protein
MHDLISRISMVVALQYIAVNYQIRSFQLKRMAKAAFAERVKSSAIKLSLKTLFCKRLINISVLKM